MTDSRKGKTWEEIYGKEEADRRRESLRESNSQRFKINNPGMKKGDTWDNYFGKEKADEMRIEVGEKTLFKKGSHPYSGKTWEEMYGEDKAREMRESMRKNNPGFKKGEDNWSCNNDVWNKGKKMPESSIRKMVEHMPDMHGQNNPFYGKKHTEKTKQQIRETVCSKFSECLDFSQKRPNFMENLLFTWLQEKYPNEFKYTGDFSFMIAGRNPDFVNCNGKKLIIEFFGDHWHKPEDEDIKRNIYLEYGYRTLVIWGHEMKDKVSVMNRIDEFIGGQKV